MRPCRAEAKSVLAGFMSVSIGPGLTLLTVMPRGPRSRAMPFTRPVRADLLIAYTAPPAKGMRSALVLLMLMMRPPSIMCAAAALDATKTPRTLTATVLSKSSSENWSTGPSSRTPALLTRMSSLPKRSATLSMARVSATGSDASALMATALPPRASISATSASAAMADALKPMATVAPSLAKRRAVAAPMPREPPLMNATLPFRLSVFMMLFLSL